MGPHTCLLQQEYRECASINEEQSLQIHNQFWGMSTWDEKKTFVRTSVQREDVKQKTKGIDSSRRQSIFLCVSIVEGKSMKVCNNFFVQPLVFLR